MLRSDQIREYMDVVSADGYNVGNVERILATELSVSDESIAAVPSHHMIPFTWVERVDDKVRLNTTRDDAEQLWKMMA
jgi:hypothetical protein